MTLAAARDDQFLVEHDLHEAAAPTSRLLQDRDHHVPGQTVAVSHHVTIFVPEPKPVTASQEITRPPERISSRPLTHGMQEVRSSSLRSSTFPQFRGLLC